MELELGSAACDRGRDFSHRSLQPATAAKVTKKYDAAKTPHKRLLEHPDVLDDVDAKLLAK